VLYTLRHCLDAGAPALLSCSQMCGDIGDLQ
jgi:hypothetical protein